MRIVTEPIAPVVPRIVYFFLSLEAPLVLAVPRNSLERFFLCLPNHESIISYVVHVTRHVKKDGLNPPHMQGALTLLSRGLLDLVGLSVADESVVWLELLHGLGGIVEEGEAGALAATVLGAETEDGDLVLGDLVERGELLAELILGDVGTRWVEDVTIGKMYQFLPWVVMFAFRGGGGGGQWVVLRTRPSACGPGGGCG